MQNIPADFNKWKPGATGGIRQFALRRNTIPELF